MKKKLESLCTVAVARLVRCSSFFWGKCVIGASDKPQELLGQVVCLLTVWIGMAMPVSGLGIVTDQGVSGREELLAPPWETKSVVSPNSIHKIEIHWIEDAEGLGIRVVKILADTEEHPPQMGSGPLPLMPPGHEPSGKKTNGKPTGGTICSNPIHKGDWKLGLSIALGAIAGLAFGIGVVVIWEEWQCGTFKRWFVRGNSSTND